MAARNITFGGGTTNNQIDLIDVAALVVVPITWALMVGVFTWQINVFGGYDFTQSLWTIAGVSISPALLLTLGGEAWIIVTNILNSKTEHGQEEMAVIGTALALPLLYVFVPAVESLVNYHDMTQLAAVLYLSAASVFVSYRA
ncbi:hypothetical protein C479_11335 [Halovivax asiaticus JCM 14624]|uniref:Uncharacterized protein n=1 Tax=Halovivax asiaticus JCM 14624 TaxID=1227490 RepID=M0BID7_9EURY|nr:hypothetical protein [Halovivax asiaticus]ELZ09409.1 hypothetical protein C479_11335 [Halovivax asiaticus JCM 14624]